MEHNEQPFKGFDLMSIYAPTPGTKWPALMVSLEDNHILAGMVINETQRQASHRVFKRMVKGPIVKVTVVRWVTVG